MSENHRGMQAKTIRKILHSKLENWLESITDQSLVGDIKRDVIVTGGSITSMLLGEKINDYDVYFKTKETTKKVAEYYVSKFNSINNTKSASLFSFNPQVLSQRVEMITNILNFTIQILLQNLQTALSKMLKKVRSIALSSCHRMLSHCLIVCKS